MTGSVANPSNNDTEVPSNDGDNVPLISPNNFDGRDASQTRIWATPWVLMLIALYMFAVPWVISNILLRYFLKPDWGTALPGLDSTPLRKVTMGGHMSMGAISLLIGPFQLIPWLRRRFPVMHRWAGRIYCSCAMLSSVFGLIFIALKGQLVGGWNMTAAFAAAGAAIGILAFKVWQTARLAKLSSVPMDYTSHRNWAIRSYSQILAPMLYRYWYLAMDLFKMYTPPLMPSTGLVCHDDDVCPDYLRIIDMLHCWTYWLSSLAVAEVIIYFLPPHSPKPSSTPSQTSDIFVDDSASVLEYNNPTSDDDELTARTPLLRGTANDYSGEPRLEGSDPNTHISSPTVVNLVGWSLAVVTMVITATIFS